LEKTFKGKTGGGWETFTEAVLDVVVKKEGLLTRVWGKGAKEGDVKGVCSSPPRVRTSGRGFKIVPRKCPRKKKEKGNVYLAKPGKRHGQKK